MTDWPRDLTEVDAEIWRRLSRATVDRKAAWRLVQLATVTPIGAPAIRTLVLRAVDRPTRSVDLHTDARSDKIDDLTANPTVAVHLWDPKGQTQLRLGGEVSILTPEDDLTGAIWDDLPAGSKAPYRQAAVPGAALDDPEGTIDSAPPRGDAAAFQDFRVLRIAVRAIDWLWLRRGGHRRARFRYGDDGRLAESGWIGP